MRLKVFEKVKIKFLLVADALLLITQLSAAFFWISVARSICSKIAGFGDFLSPGQILAITPVLLHFYVTIFHVWHLIFQIFFQKNFSKKLLIEVLQKNSQNCALNQQKSPENCHFSEKYQKSPNFTWKSQAIFKNFLSPSNPQKSPVWR